MSQTAAGVNGQREMGASEGKVGVLGFARGVDGALSIGGNVGWPTRTPSGGHGGWMCATTSVSYRERDDPH